MGFGALKPISLLGLGTVLRFLFDSGHWTFCRKPPWINAPIRIQFSRSVSPVQDSCRFDSLHSSFKAPNTCRLSVSLYKIPPSMKHSDIFLMGMLV